MAINLSEQDVDELLVRIIKNISKLDTDDILIIDLKNEDDSVINAPEGLDDILEDIRVYTQHAGSRADAQQKHEEEHPVEVKNKKDRPDAMSRLMSIMTPDFIRLNNMLNLSNPTIIAKIRILGEQLQSKGVYCIYLQSAMENSLLQVQPSKKAQVKIQKDINICERKMRRPIYLLSRLESECKKYGNYLFWVIQKEAGLTDEDATENKKNPGKFYQDLKELKDPWDNKIQGNASLKDAIEKYKVVHQMYLSVSDSLEPVQQRIANFTQILEKNRSVIEKRRDSAGMTFLKVIASILSLGIATPFLFSSKGADVSDKMEYFISKHKPK